jgi:hypothetical protein
MKKTLRVLVTLSILASSILFSTPQASAIGTLYALGTNNNNGDVACSISGFFTISDNVVRESNNCVGEANIPLGPHTIGYMSLASNTITSVSISNSVTHIRDEAFIRSSSIESVTFGNSVSYIGGGAFAGMTALTSLTLPESLRQIDGGAFSGMNPAITSITIPNGVVGVGAWAFNGVNFTSYRYCGNSLSNWTLYRSELDRLPNTCQTDIGTLYSPSTGSGDVACTTGFFTILENVVIGSKECTGVVNVPSGVTSIAEGVFGGRALTSVTIPNSVLSIGAVAFGASGLTSLTLGNGITSIGHEAFLWTNSLSSYSYCGTLLTDESLEVAFGLRDRVCVQSSATITAGEAPNSQVATFATGVTEAVIPASAELPAIKLSFTSTAPTSVTVVPLAANPASVFATPFTISTSTKIVDITLSSAHDGSPVTICLDGALTDSIFHFTGGAWVELPERSYVNGQVCGVTNSFSPFAAAPAAPIPTPVAPMLPTDKPTVTLSHTLIMCTMGIHSQTPTSAVFSLFVDGEHISTNFSAVGDYLPSWIIPWASAGTITRTASLTSATWAMNDAYKGKSITCTTLAYSAHATGLTSSEKMMVK